MKRSVIQKNIIFLFKNSSSPPKAFLCLFYSYSLDILLRLAKDLIHKAIHPYIASCLFLFARFEHLNVPISISRAIFLLFQPTYWRVFIV